MLYQDRVLAFVDILGFSDAIKKTTQINNGNEIPYETQRIDNLLNEVEWQLKYKDILTKGFSDSLKIESKITSQFSDSIVISYLDNEEIHKILLDVYSLCIMALGNGFLLRGVITGGKVLHTEKKIFGPALVRAYELESSIAKYPRIIIDRNILDLAKTNYSKYENPASEYNDMMKIVSIDFDDIPFINYIDKLYTGVDCGNEAIERHYKNIKNIIIEMDIYNKSINEKYIWLKRKLEESRSSYEVRKIEIGIKSIQ